MSEWVSDYTPSIQGMRETYEETHFYEPHTNSVKEKNAEFDRFLELVYQVERERIRNLLGEFGMKLEKEVSDGDNYSLGRYNAISEFIAILDGELHE